MYCKLSLPERSSSPSPPSSPLSLPSSSLNTPTFLLLGKSIVIQEQQQQQQHELCNHQMTTSHNNKTLINSINENPMRHSKRIRQLFLPVCTHGVEHEIANHYKDVKNKKASKEARAKAKQQLHEQRKKATLAKLVSTAFVHRRRPPPSSTLSTSIIHHRQFISSHQRHVLQIPSFTFPR